jgi:ABC-type sugar transport system substrate-binding protein
MAHEAKQSVNPESHNAVASDGLSDHPQAVYTPPPGLDAALDHLPLVEVGAGAPKRIGYLTNYSFHIWYQILIEIIRRRAEQYGATVTVLDAELSVERQIQQAQQLFEEVDALIERFQWLLKRTQLRG